MGGDDEGWGKVWQEKTLTAIWTPALRRGAVGAGVDGSPGWQMREQMEALLGGQTSRSWSGAMRDGWGRLPDFVFVYENPKSGGDEEML